MTSKQIRHIYDSDSSLESTAENKALVSTQKHNKDKSELLGKYAYQATTSFDDETEDKTNASMKRTTDLLNGASRTTAVTIDIGSTILSNLDAQGNKLRGMNDRLINTNNNIGRSDGILTRIICRIKKQKIILIVICLLMLAIIVGILIFKLK